MKYSNFVSNLSMSYHPELERQREDDYIKANGIINELLKTSNNIPNVLAYILNDPTLASACLKNKQCLVEIKRNKEALLPLLHGEFEDFVQNGYQNIYKKATQYIQGRNQSKINIYNLSIIDCEEIPPPKLIEIDSKTLIEIKQSYIKQLQNKMDIIKYVLSIS